MNSLILKLVFVFVSVLFIQNAHGQDTPDISADLPAGLQKVSIGSFQSRAYWIASSKANQPVVILVPGSGPNGPEEVAPPEVTADGQYHSIFGPFAKAFVSADYNVLMLGKPGVEYFTDGDRAKWLYDLNMYQTTKWTDLVLNLKNGMDYVLTQKNIDTSKIFLLGHSEGTQVVLDYTSANPTLVKGLFLLGYMGTDMATVADWQLYKRDIELWLSPDVDTDKDGALSLTEMSTWPELAGNESFTLQEYEASLRADAQYQQYYEYFKNLPLYAGVFNRGPVYALTASLAQDVYILNGELDVATPVSQVTPLILACTNAKKTNYSIEIVKGLSHGFSELKGTRKQALLDNTMGPVEASFVNQLEATAKAAR